VSPLTYLLTYSMVQSLSWEANWFAASQEIPRISRDPKVHYWTHKRPPPVSILGQPNPVHIPTSHFLEIHPNIIHPSTPRSHQWSLSLWFPHQDPIHPLLLIHTRHMRVTTTNDKYTEQKQYFRLFAVMTRFLLNRERWWKKSSNSHTQKFLLSPIFPITTSKCWITTLAVMFLVRCVLEFRCGIRVAGFSLQHGYHSNQPHRNSNTHRNKNTQPMWWYNRKVAGSWWRMY